MEEDVELEKSIELLLWGKKGYPLLKDTPTSAFSIRKVIDFLKKKQESDRGNDL